MLAEVLHAKPCSLEHRPDKVYLLRPDCKKLVSPYLLLNRKTHHLHMKGFLLNIQNVSICWPVSSVFIASAAQLHISPVCNVWKSIVTWLYRIFNRQLENNPEQRAAVQHILAGSSKPAPHLVFGPPGTGKTITLVEAMNQVLSRVSVGLIQHWGHFTQKRPYGCLNFSYLIKPLP